MTKNDLAQQVADLQKQLSQMQQMASLGELVGTTTHEFNNYLMTIINYAKLGMRHTDQQSRDKAFQKIFDAGQKAAQLTTVILGTAKNRSDQLEPTSLKQVIDQTMILLERELRKFQVNVELNLNETPLALANGNQIQQVLINLLVNARQAIGTHGTIYLSLDQDPAQEWVEIKVKDTGAGMAPDVLQRIFEPRFSTKSGPDETGKGGTGFGLSNCRQIIEAHQGRIRVESSVGKGTCFTLRFRKAESTQSAPAPQVDSQSVA